IPFIPPDSRRHCDNLGLCCAHGDTWRQRRRTATADSIHTAGQSPPLRQPGAMLCPWRYMATETTNCD
ncbi:hypothetical protein C7E17_27385, partial [Stenotrophomonas maltophilia]